MSNVIAYIMLRESCSRTDIPRVLVCCDYFNSYEMGEIDRLIFRAKLVDINYDVFISAKTEHKKRSPEHCLKQRLRSLENRAKKHCSLFWEEVVKEEIAKRPRYYTIEGIAADKAEIEKYLSAAEKNFAPALSINELEDWLIRHSPFINPEIDRLMQTITAKAKKEFLKLMWK